MKIRLNYVSNSSSSSYVIACKGDGAVTKIINAYKDTYAFWMKMNPNHIGYGLDVEPFELSKATDLIKHFKDMCMSKEDIKYNKECFTKEEDKGYKFLRATVASDDGTCEYRLMEMFLEYVLPALKGEYDWDTNKYRNDIDLVFNTRWS